MRRPKARPLVAALLAAAAVAIPAIAWWLTGQAEVERQVERLQADARRALTDRAENLASRLEGRLQSLQSSESVRPHFHYTNPYHDAETDRLVDSPLALGPEDPLILAYFQLSPDHLLTLPTIRDRAERHRHAATTGQHEIHARLALSAGELAEAAAEASLVVLPDPHTVLPGRLRWRTVEAKPPLLVASRYLVTSGGTWVQGFAVNVEEAQRFLSTGHHPVRLGPGRPGLHGQARLDLPGLSWRLVVDSNHAGRAAATEARWLRSDFRKTFALGVGLALVAAIALVGWVWQADRLARQRSTFAAVAAHELRTPLAGLRLQADLIAEGLGDPERTTLNARRIGSEVERLGRVVRNVLDVSRLEQGQLALSPTSGDLAALVSEVVESMRAGIEAAGATIETLLPEDARAVMFDPDAVTSILQNLIDNAVKYARKAEQRLIQVAIERNGHEVVLSVRDYGPGLPDSLRRRRFRFFTRGREAESVSGLGLGLALSSQLAREQQGRLSAENLDVGARLSLTLPAV